MFFTYFNALCSGACSNLHHQLVFCKAWMDQQACLKDVISWHVDSICSSACVSFPTLYQSRVCYLYWHGSEPTHHDQSVCVLLVSCSIAVSKPIMWNLNAQSWRSISYYWQSYCSDSWSALLKCALLKCMRENVLLGSLLTCNILL